MAHEHIRLLFKKSMFKNLFDAHPPFQIDGNFGYTAGIAEMLVQSHEEGVIRLLPALPDAWTEGSVSGLCARSGYELSMDWESGVLKQVTLHSNHGGEVKLISGDKKVNLNTSAGETILLDW
jgi:alpha-L-fucosidase 2